MSLSPRAACIPTWATPARTRWSNLPAGASPRPGVSIGDLSDSQRVLLHDLLRASTSSQGYHKLTGAIRAEEVLQAGKPQLFGPAYYYTSVFGSPEDANWAWMLTGHHMSAMFTVAGDRTAFTPMFTGAQPLQIPSGVYAGWQVLPQDAARAGELLAALSADQQKLAVIGTSAPSDVVAGPGRQASLTSFQGIPVAQLDVSQQRLFWLLVQEFVRNADFDAADAQLALIRQSWGDTHFAWQGPPPDPTARFYFRVPRYLNPQAEHVLDWFHITMRLTVMHQMAKGLRSRANTMLAIEVAEELERLKWLLWHGNVFRGLQTIQDLEVDLDVEYAAPEQRKLLKMVTEFGGYIRANGAGIPNNGERYRCGETISSSRVLQAHDD
ncbi:MAG: DUF3500 domain-containing protein [Chloroflexota bacterium]